MRPTRKRSPTKTQSFGSSGREGHDSSKFYRRKIYDNGNESPSIRYMENQITPEHLDKVFCKSSEKMDELPDSSVHLMVTSPPYNVGKEYDQDLTLTQYRQLLKAVFKETFRVLVPGGRACINIANIGRKPYVPMSAYVTLDMEEIGFLNRGQIIWNKSASSGTSTAWGSWKSASNPTLRDTHEYILVFCKESFSRKQVERRNTITAQEFLTFTKSVWEFPAESANRVGHPAPFPVELPYRCIQLFTFANDVVLDPFCGVGATCVAAARSGRRFVGYDVNPEYVNVARRRASQSTVSQFSA